jgi:hypothetical protein
MLNDMCLIPVLLATVPQGKYSITVKGCWQASAFLGSKSSLLSMK